MGSLIHFSGHQHLRHRLVLSILSGKHVRIDNIRPDDKNPGLQGWHPVLLGQLAFFEHTAPDFEISLLRLLEKVTNGTIIEISVTGTCIARLLVSRS
jgi:RNA 3'-terminal phosphate cyclase-like protein